jgi:hypothetical protein
MADESVRQHHRAHAATAIEEIGASEVLQNLRTKAADCAFLDGY